MQEKLLALFCISLGDTRRRSTLQSEGWNDGIVWVRISGNLGTEEKGKFGVRCLCKAYLDVVFLDRSRPTDGRARFVGRRSPPIAVDRRVLAQSLGHCQWLATRFWVVDGSFFASRSASKLKRHRRSDAAGGQNLSRYLI